MNPASDWSRLLAILAWLMALLCYGLLYLGFWGIASGAMLVWSILGVPLELLSRHWLARAGAPVGRWAGRCVTWMWAALLLVQAMLYGFMAQPTWNGGTRRYDILEVMMRFDVLYWLFPITISIVGIYRAAAMRPAARSDESLQPSDATRASV